MKVNQYHKFLFITLLVVLVTIPSFSQFSQSDRFEKVVVYHDKDFNIISLSEEGIALVREKNKFKSGKQFWEVTLLDTALHEKNTVELELPVGNEFTGFEYEPGFVHLLFLRKETMGEMKLISINLKSGDADVFEINIALVFSLAHFFKVGNGFVLGGYVNMEPSVLLYSPQSKTTKIVPGFFLKNTELVDMRANQNQTFNAVLLEKGDNGTRKIIFRIYDSAGKQLFDNTVNIDEEITLQNAVSSALQRDDLLIAGTWGKRSAKQALGFYTLPVNPFTEQKISRLYLGQLNHYLDYMKPKKAAKIKSRTSKALEHGKFPDFSSYLMPYKILEYEKGFLVFAEVYTQSSNADSRYPRSPYYSYLHQETVSSSTPNSSDPIIVPEINKLESVLIAFSPDGSVLWDYSIKLMNVKRPKLEQVVDFQYTKDCIQFIYKNESELIQKKIDFTTEKATDYADKVKLPDLFDAIQSESKDVGMVTNWFGKNFYVWGYQTILNKKAKKTRDVFYINKVTVR